MSEIQITTTDDDVTDDELCTQALIETTQSFVEAMMEAVTGLKSGRLGLGNDISEVMT